MIKEFLKGTSITIIGQIIYFIISILTNIYFANKFSPELFGQLSIVLSLATIGKVVSEGGLGGSLIRSEKIESSNFEIIFTFSVIISLGYLIITFLFSNLIAEFFNNLNLSIFIRVSSIIPIISSFQIIGNIILLKKLSFKKRSLIQTLSICIATSLSILLVEFGIGPIVILLFHVFNAMVLSLFYISISYKFLKINTNFRILSEHFKFGFNTSLPSLINIIVDSLIYSTLSKWFGMINSGLFYQAKKLFDIPVFFLETIAQSVFYPIGSKEFQKNKKSFLNIFHRLKIALLIISFIFSLVLILLSDEFIHHVYGEDWNNSAFYFKILMISFTFVVFESLFKVLVKVMFETHIYLRVFVIKNLFLFVSVFLSVFFKEINIILYSFIFSGLFATIIMHLSEKKLISNLSKEIQL